MANRAGGRGRAKAAPWLDVVPCGGCGGLMVIDDAYEVVLCELHGRFGIVHGGGPCGALWDCESSYSLPMGMLPGGTASA